MYIHRKIIYNILYYINISLSLPLSLQESFVQEVELLAEEILANDLKIEGEYVSEETMKTDWGWTQ